ncbi:GIY-YIG nuclease family protein [Sphingobacterium sp. 1.A.4]|uniref:GIY-YIG nuclease family protein n=1 Tax=Sphingobacterium sp. 1.A.4 TaxID=2044603 RepID=UPI000C0BFD2E|nr:GIY-YIG nuclease family protein [Sphingobacterium sp. 1.A.4]
MNLKTKQLLCKRGGCVYIITNYNNTTLYTGVTSDLAFRMYQHVNKLFERSFSSKYNLYKLVYYKFYSTIDEAISEEKRIKAGSRSSKERLINEINPGWIDLYKTEVINW